jgi:LasA protease
LNRFKLLLLSIFLALLTFSACVRFYSSNPIAHPNPNHDLLGTIVAQTLTAFSVANLQPGPTETIAVTAIPPSLLERPEYAPGELVDYVTQSGDTFPALAAHFDSTIAGIQAANPQVPLDTTTLQPGLQMKIPITYSPFWGTRTQIMPDSLFVNGPSVIGFDTRTFASTRPGWLKDYREDLGGNTRAAAELVDIVATNFSISPRTLLVLLEYESSALSQPGPSSDAYPLGHIEDNTLDLYDQLVSMANMLNAGYYGWRTGSLTRFQHPDGSLERPDPWQTAATVAFQYYFSRATLASYTHATGPDGLKQVYLNMFGDPWPANVDLPNIPVDLKQPALVLPFPAGYTWSLTGGPHSAWGAPELQPWAALDFAPAVLGCAASPDPAVAMADGIVVRSEAGIVMEDLDGDRNERTGWNILHFHIAAEGEALFGQPLKTGDPLGFPSCEGGSATGSHVHVARKYNGEWIPIDGVIPFDMDGWIAHTGSAFYKGTLTRGSQVVTASLNSNPARLIRAGP